MNELENRQNACNAMNVTSFTQVSNMMQHGVKMHLGGDEIRMVDPMIDLIYPPVPFPSNKIFKAMGEERIREMVRHQHRLLRKTKVGELFPKDDEAFHETVEKSADFFVEALGGGDIFTRQHGEPHLRMRHFKVPIDENAREIWLAVYKKTLREIDFPKECLEEFWNWIEPLSIRMINRRTTMEGVKRLYWSSVRDELTGSAE